MTLKKVETEYSALRAGSGMVLYLHFVRTGKCHILAPGGQTPSRPELAIESFPGLDVKSTDLSFGEIDPIKDTALTGARKFLLTVRIAAGPEINPGQLEIPAALTYTALDQKGTPATETAKFNLPLKVVAQGTAVKHQDPNSKLRAMDYIALIVLAPIIFPLALIAWLAGWDGC
jgi:hypothetical protein